MEHVHPMPGQATLALDRNNPMTRYEAGQPLQCCMRRLVPEGWRQVREPGNAPGQPLAPLAQANVMTSAVEGTGGRWHRPVLDIDVPARLIPSSTSGHHHLIIDQQVSWPIYAQTLRALAAAGVVEIGWAHSALTWGYSAVRLPWERKPTPGLSPA